MEPEAHSPDTSIKRDAGSEPPDTLPGGRIHYRIDREHPIGGEMSDVLRGILTKPWQLLLLMVAVILLTLQAFAINRAAGIPYPLWNPIREQPAAGGDIVKDSSMRK